MSPVAQLLSSLVCIDTKNKIQVCQGTQYIRWPDCLAGAVIAGNIIHYYTAVLYVHGRMNNTKFLHIVSLTSHDLYADHNLHTNSDTQ